jgi:hypothetical protein
MPGRWKTPSDASSSSAWPERQPEPEQGSSGSTDWISDRDIQARYLCGWREFDDLVSPHPG